MSRWRSVTPGSTRRTSAPRRYRPGSTLDLMVSSFGSVQSSVGSGQGIVLLVLVLFRVHLVLLRVVGSGPFPQRK